MMQLTHNWQLNSLATNFVIDFWRWVIAPLMLSMQCILMPLSTYSNHIKTVHRGVKKTQTVRAFEWNSHKKECDSTLRTWSTKQNVTAVLSQPSWCNILKPFSLKNIARRFAYTINHAAVLAKAKPLSLAIFPSSLGSGMFNFSSMQ